MKTEKLGEQRPALFEVADQHVLNVDERGTATGLEALGRPPRRLPLFGIKRAIAVTADLIKQGEQFIKACFNRTGGLEPGLGRRPLQAFEKLLLLT
ncbi:hypothetical protein D3C76_1695480 [compost metagenome]